MLIISSIILVSYTSYILYCLLKTKTNKILLYWIIYKDKHKMYLQYCFVNLIILPVALNWCPIAQDFQNA